MLKDLNVQPLLDNGVPLVVMDDLRQHYPDKFNPESGQMNYQWFESEIRPHKFIMMRRDVNSLTFTLKSESNNGATLQEALSLLEVLAIAQVNKAQHLPEASRLVWRAKIRNKFTDLVDSLNTIESK